MISPVSTPESTKCTVQPVILTPAVSACLHASSPGKEGRSFEKWSFDEAHVASEDDQLGAGCLKFLDKLGLDILGKAGSEFRLVDHGCGDSKIISQRQNAGVGHIRRREHGCDPEMSRHDRGEDRAEVGTFSRTENGNFKLRHVFIHIARQTRARGVLSFRNFGIRVEYCRGGGA